MGDRSRTTPRGRGLIRDRYEPLETLASGGSGSVVRALDHEHGRVVTISAREAGTAELRTAMQWTARKILDLGPHESLPTVRDGFLDDDRYHLVADWVEGRSVWDLRSEPLSPERAIAILRSVAAALAHLHEHGLVHGDVRPGNVIVTPRGGAVLVNVDPAGAIARPREGEHVAPECMRGEAATAASDVYGLAATARELLRGVRSSAASLALERALRRGTAEDPGSRPGGPAMLVDELAEAVEPAMPVGTVTFLMTDVEGSTRLWERHREEMSAALARHDEIVAGTVRSHGGRLIKTRGEGDSTFSVFERAGDAVRCAAALRIAFDAEPWPTPEPLRARAAVHTGEAELRDGDYYGPVVNRCARLRAVGRGGQVLISDVTQELVKEQLPPGTVLHALGTRDLKDLDRAEEVFELAPEGTRRTRSFRIRRISPLAAMLALVIVAATTAAVVIRLGASAPPAANEVASVRFASEQAGEGIVVARSWTLDGDALRGEVVVRNTGDRSARVRVDEPVPRAVAERVSDVSFVPAYDRLLERRPVLVRYTLRVPAGAERVIGYDVEVGPDPTRSAQQRLDAWAARQQATLSDLARERAPRSERSPAPRPVVRTTSRPLPPVTEVSPPPVPETPPAVPADLTADEHKLIASVNEHRAGHALPASIAIADVTELAREAARHVRDTEQTIATQDVSGVADRRSAWMTTAMGQDLREIFEALKRSNAHELMDRRALRHAGVGVVTRGDWYYVAIVWATTD